MHTGRSTAAGRAMIGLDTGFFLRFLENDPTAVQAWRDIVGGEEAVVSSLTLFELKRLSLKGMVDAPAFEVMNDAIAAVCKIQWIDNTDVLMAGAGISHGGGFRQWIHSSLRVSWPRARTRSSRQTRISPATKRKASGC